MQVLDVLADPTRRRIVELLAQGERPVGEIARAVAISQPAASQHLRALREARLVRVRARAQQRLHALDPAGIAELEAWCARLRGFWAARLDALEAALAAENAVRAGPGAGGGTRGEG